MDNKYTPGPWTINKNVTETNYLLCCDISDRNRGYVANLAVTNEDALSNAQLISAAPDLLEALKEILPMAELGAAKPGHEGSCGPWASCDCGCMQAAYASESLLKARKAIRKAEGKVITLPTHSHP